MINQKMSHDCYNAQNTSKKIQFSFQRVILTQVIGLPVKRILKSKAHYNRKDVI